MPRNCLAFDSKCIIPCVVRNVSRSEPCGVQQTMKCAAERGMCSNSVLCSEQCIVWPTHSCFTELSKTSVSHNPFVSISQRSCTYVL